MSNTGESSDSNQLSHLPSEETPLAKEQLEKCLEMLKAARNDNEKMASLLLFTHLMKNNESLAVDSGELFRAIGPHFIVRLLNSKNAPDGCPRLMYKSLALNILTSFKQDFLFDPLIVSSLFSICEVLSLGDGIAEAPDLLKDSVQVLQIFSTSQRGCNHLLQNNCIPVICQAVLNNPEMNSLFEVLKGILLYLPLETWSLCETELNGVLDRLCETFCGCQDMEKFTTCDNLVVILASLCEKHGENEKSKLSFAGSWMGNIRKGIQDILQSRCKIGYKYSALQLAAGMIELFGVVWCLGFDPIQLDLSNTKLWLILLSIAKTEAKIILESDNDSEIEEKAAVMVACYRIFEKTIEFLITDQKSGWCFSDDLVLHLHAILMESFDCIIKFLIQLGTSATNNPEESTRFQTPIVLATIRVLCAWLSEETNSLSDEVMKVLPILISWARRSLEEGMHTEGDCKTGNKIISYLLPPLCHLSADETFCGILIENEAHVLLAKFFNHLWLQQEIEGQEYPSSLITLCNVFLNFCVLEVELIKNNPVFQDLLNCIMVSLPKMVGTGCIVLKAHFVLLGLLLFRHRCPLGQANLSAQENSFLKAVICFLQQAHTSISGGPLINFSLVTEWDNISELWFLSVQNLVACAKGIMAVKKILLLSSWVEDTKLWLQSCEQSNENTLTDMKSALLPIASLG